MQSDSAEQADTSEDAVTSGSGVAPESGGASAEEGGSSTTSLRLAELVASLPGMAEIEKRVASKFVSEAPLLTEISHYLFSIGGKRIRPVIALLSGKLFGMPKPTEPLIDVAAGIELIHMATLLHDDIIDKSPLRRHKKSPFATFGADSTLLTGDFLLTRAFSLCARLDGFIIDRTEDACIALTEGEILEVPLHTQPHTVESTITIGRKKTAALFVLAAECGAHLAGAGKEATTLAGQFGEKLGIVFQLLDDILDVTATEEELGKRPGIDILERKPSIVNVLWLASGSALAKKLLSPPCGDESAFVAAALQELRGSSVIEEARALAHRYADEASAHLTAATKASQTTISRVALAQFQGLIAYSLRRLR